MTLLLERGDIPGFKVGRRRRRHEKRGGARVRGHRVSGLVQRWSSAAAEGGRLERMVIRTPPKTLAFGLAEPLDG